MNHEIVSLFRGMNAAGRGRRANDDCLALLEDAFLEAKGEETHATRFLSLLRRYVAAQPPGRFVCFVHGKVWWSVRVYEPPPLVLGVREKGRRNKYPRRVLSGRVRCRIVLDQERMEWQTWYDGGTFLTADGRATIDLAKLVEGLEAANAARHKAFLHNLTGWVDPDAENVEPGSQPHRTEEESRAVMEQAAEDLAEEFEAHTRDLMEPDGAHRVDGAGGGD